MAKKKKGKQASVSEVLPIIDLQFDDPLFALSAHPSKPLILAGLGTGHVSLHKYNDSVLQELLEKNIENSMVAEELEDTAAKSNDKKNQKKKKLWSVIKAYDDEASANIVDTVWKTKRHKSSCRIVLMDKLTNGDFIYTIGKDNVIKKAFTETGKVDFKKNVDEDYQDEGNGISCAVLSDINNHLIVGNEKGGVKVYDTRAKFGKLFEIENVHDDMVNQIITIPNATSNYHFISVGSTTVSKIDIRKGVLLQSENQEDEVLSAVFPNANSSDSLVCGMGSGVVTQWKESKNDYVDQLSRIKVSKDNSIDCLISTMDEDDPDSFWATCADGNLYKVNSKKSCILETRIHDELDEPNILDIDYDYKLISASMGSVKIWNNKISSDILDDITKRNNENDDEKVTSDLSESDSSEWSDLSGDECAHNSSGSDDNVSGPEKKRGLEQLAVETNKKQKLIETKKNSTNKAQKAKATSENKNFAKQPNTLLNSRNRSTNGIMKFDDL